MSKRSVSRPRNFSVAVERKNKLWPVIWCNHEARCIAVSRNPIAVRNTNGTNKSAKVVDKSQWQSWNSEFRDTYYIDMSKYVAGELVMCPKCGNPVDFRLFPSHYSPNLVKVDEHENQKNRINQFPDTREENS